MRIQHNIMAMSAYRNYTNNVSAMKKNLEKLSSGYKINRAGDDAAGLAISEKMRAQITGLETAQKNAKDGISLVQTAEGALTEVHDMLNRMVELATMSANGTYDNTTDRAQLQKEMDQLRSEIDRIADSSNFNGIKLLDGSMDAGGGTTQATVNILPDGGTPIGDIGTKTVLKKSGTPAKETKFAVEFDTLAVSPKAGEKLSVQIGNNAAIDITFDAADEAAGKLDAKALATKLNAAFAAGNKQIGGQEFTAEVGENGTSVVFTQKEKPTGTTDTVEGSMTVKMSFTDKAGTVHNLDDGIALLAEGDVGEGNAELTVDGTAGSAIEVKAAEGGANGTFTVSVASKTADDLNTKTIDGVAISWDKTDDTADLASTMAAFVETYNKTEGKEYTASYANDTLTLTAKEQKEITTKPKTDISGTDTEMTQGTEGKAPTTAAVTLNATGLDKEKILAAATSAKADDKITISKNGENKLELKVGNTVIGTSDALDGAKTDFEIKSTDGNTSFGTVKFSAAPATADTINVETGLSIKAAGDDGEGGTPTETTQVTADITATDVDFKDEQATLDNTKIATIKGLGEITIDAGANGNALKIDLNNISLDTSNTSKDAAQAILNMVSKAVDDWNAANTDADFTYANPKLLDKDGNIMTLAAGDKITIQVDKVPKNAGGTGAGASVEGSYNAGTRLIEQGAAVKADQRASTVIDLNEIYGGDIGDGSTLTIGEKTITFKWGDANSASGDTITLDKNATAADRINFAGDALSHITTAAFTIGNRTNDGKISIDEKAGNTKYGEELKTYEGFKGLFSATKVAATDPTKGLKLQIGDTADSFNQLKVSIGDTHCDALGIDKNSISIAKQDDAANAIDAIKRAINTVSDIRGTLGATQNRLDHTINNLSVMTENIQDAESTIRDVDVAEEMMAYTKNNILIQSAQAMLAQANQVPQGVLQLLQ